MKNKSNLIVIVQKSFFQFIYFQNSSCLSVLSIFTLNKNLHVVHAPFSQGAIRNIQKIKSSKKNNRFVKKY